MSADNWTICPQCKKNFPMSTDRELTTYREDWELGSLTEKDPPEFYIYYTGRCRSCNYGIDYHYNQPLPPLK